MNPPLPFQIYRVVQLVLIVAILLLVGLGLSGHGPLHGLYHAFDRTRSWFEVHTGIWLQ